MEGMKFDNTKPRTDLVLGGFANALLEVSKVGTLGAKKYADNNWLEVENGIERYNSAMLRHYLLSKEEVVDAESGLMHVAHMAWNALAVLELMLLWYPTEGVPTKPVKPEYAGQMEVYSREELQALLKRLEDSGISYPNSVLQSFLTDLNIKGYTRV